MNINIDISEEITNDWIECFSKPENQNGIMWRLALSGMFPVGVNENHPEVIRILSLGKSSTLSNNQESSWINKIF